MAYGGAYPGHQAASLILPICLICTATMADRGQKTRSRSLVYLRRADSAPAEETRSAGLLSDVALGTFLVFMGVDVVDGSGLGDWLVDTANAPHMPSITMRVSAHFLTLHLSACRPKPVANEPASFPGKRPRQTSPANVPDTSCGLPRLEDCQWLAVCLSGAVPESPG